MEYPRRQSLLNGTGDLLLSCPVLHFLPLLMIPTLISTSKFSISSRPASAFTSKYYHGQVATSTWVLPSQIRHTIKLSTRLSSILGLVWHSPHFYLHHHLTDRSAVHTPLQFEAATSPTTWIVVIDVSSSVHQIWERVYLNHRFVVFLTRVQPCIFSMCYEVESLSFPYHMEWWSVILNKILVHLPSDNLTTL